MSASAAPASSASIAVCVFYDSGQGAYPNGRLHAIMLENLLGHFRETRVRLLPVSDPQPQPLTGCDRVAYIGSYFHENIPARFLKAAASFDKPLLWMNYNIDQLQKAMGPENFVLKTGFVFQRVVGFDGAHGPARIPGFFRFVLYKGARFSKFVFRRSGNQGVIAAPDIALIQVKTARVLATALHSTSEQSTPYAVRRGGFFFIADNPFLFIHEQDRYLVLADLLFDFLDLPPRQTQRYALVRLEDVHPQYDVRLLRKAVRLLRAADVPFAISLIPKFVGSGVPESAGVDMDQRPEFVSAIRYARANGGEILLHGYTHEVSGLRDCVPLGSGFDYEFWDRCHQGPLPYDSTGFVLDRLHKARAILSRVGLSPVAWVTPHYAASPDDFRVFGREFPRTVQRVTYMTEDGGKTVYVSQFFPYTIYRDHYGQFIWPENLGFVPLPGSNWGAAAPDDIASSLRLAAVVRDAWASFYWHPILAAQPAEISRLLRLINEARSLGFKFVPLSELKARGE